MQLLMTPRRLWFRPQDGAPDRQIMLHTLVVLQVLYFDRDLLHLG